MDWLDNNDELRSIVLKDLNYTEQSFGEDVKKLREWLDKQPHLPQFYINNHLLEVFLSASKSVERAKEKLDSYFTAKTAYPTTFFQGDLSKIVNAKAFDTIYLPKVTEEGYRIFFVGFNENIDKMEFSVFDYAQKIFLMADYWYSFGPLTSGAVIFVDFTNAKLSTLSKIFTFPLKTFIKLGQSTNPVRPKKIILYNIGGTFRRFVDLLKSYTNPKLSKRFEVIDKGDFESLKQVIPEKLLPKDYGGSQLSVQELTDKWNTVLSESSEWCNSLLKAKSDESKRLGKPHKLMTELNFGIEGTFKKLSID